MESPYKVLINYALSLVLSGHSGVRAFLPTFILALSAAVRPDVVELSGSLSWLKNPAAISVSGILALGEMVATMIPGIENIVETVMSFVHPIMGVVMAIAPNLGDATAYTQGPMAVFGGSQALIFHLIKLLLRLMGLGFLGPCIACLEHSIVLLAVPLAIFFGGFAIALAVLLLYAVARWLYRIFVQKASILTATDQDGKERALLGGGEDTAHPRTSKLQNYIKREHSLLSIIYLAQDEGLSRPPRAGLLSAMLIAQLYFVALLVQTTIAPIGQDILIALLLIPVRSLSKAFLRHALGLGPAVALIFILALHALWLYAASTELSKLSRHHAGLVAVNFATSTFLNWGVLEPLELAFVFECCGTCCPCCAFFFIDSSDLRAAEEESSGEEASSHSHGGISGSQIPASSASGVV